MKKTYDYELGECEGCLKKICDQEKYQTTLDCYIKFCENCGYTYQDVLDQYEEFYQDKNDWPESFDDRSDFEKYWEELKSQSTEYLSQKPLSGPEVENE